ncbi:MAG: chromate transporter [Rikenellaceae bacterium]
MASGRVRLLSLLFSFMKIGVFTFGGGYAMIPLIRGEVIERRGWIENKEFMDLLTLAQSIPGPIALNSSAFVGYKMRGYIGAITSVMGVILPSFTILLIIAIFFSAIRYNPIVDAAFKGMRPVVVALIVLPVLQFAKDLNKLELIACASVGFALWWWGFSPIYVILGAIFIGAAWAIYEVRRVRK